MSARQVRPWLPTTAFAAALFAQIATLGASAQAPACPPALSVGACFDSLVIGSAGGSVTRQVRSATVGPQASGAGTATGIRDFLPVALGALLVPGVEQDRQSLSLRLNRKLGPVSAQLDLQLNEPEVFPPLLEPFAEPRRSTVRERLDSRLQDQDDVSAALALNFVGRAIGRSIEPHRNEFHALLVDLLPLDPTSTLDANVDLLEELLVRLAEGIAQERRGDAACPLTQNMPLECLTVAFRDTLVSALLPVAQAMAQRRRQRADAIEAANLALLPTLINNQPQLSLAVGYRYRDDLVGPDELMLTARYEMGLRNLNWLRRQCGGSVRAACFRRVATSPDIAETLTRGARLWLTVQANYSPEYDLVLPADTVVLELDNAIRFSASAGYGQYFQGLSVPDVPTRQARLDFEASYDFQSENAMRNGRGLATLTLTQPISDQLATVVSLLWASRPEYFGEVHRRIGATIGLSYKIVPDGS